MKADDLLGFYTYSNAYGLHANVHYNLVNTRSFKLRVGTGVNLRYFYWRINAGRNVFLYYGFKIRDVFVEDGETDLYSETNIGYNISLQTAFRVSDRVDLMFWPHIGNDFQGNIVTAIHFGVGINL